MFRTNLSCRRLLLPALLVAGLVLSAPAAASAAQQLVVTGINYPVGYVVGAPATPVGGITGSLHFAGDGCEAADFVGFPAGSIALLDPGSCATEVAAANAANSGAIGVVFIGTSATPPTLEIPLAAGIIPGATIGMEDGALLKSAFPGSAATLTTERTTDVGVSIADAPDPAGVGATVTYTITVSNNGPLAADSVVVTDTLPAQADFVDASSGCSATGGSVSCALGTLDSGSTAQVVVRVRPTAEGALVSTASVSAAIADHDTSNNSAIATTTVSGVACSITGTAKSDRLTGTSGFDVICGLGGNDTISAGGGNDLILGGDGNDTLAGQIGHDRLFGGAGNDVLSGGAGNDELFGEAGNDTLNGGADTDSCAQGPGNGAPVACEA